MKNGTSEKSSQKRRGRPKGWKAKPKVDPLKGNDTFNLTPEMEAKIAVITPEDMALDRELEAIAKERPVVDDNVPAAAMEVKKVKEHLEHLKAHVDNYVPANTMADLTEQVHVAKTQGCDSIDCTPTLVRQLFPKDYSYIDKNVGYAMYHDIRVYIAGHFEKTKVTDNQTMEQRLFQGPRK